MNRDKRRKNLETVNKEDLDNAPLFCRLLQPIFLKSPFQKKRILKHLRERDQYFWQQAEEFAQNYLAFLADNDMTAEDAANAYLRMCKDVVSEQIRFARTGFYRCSSAIEAERIVYANPEIMTYYMHGLILSQFLWNNHYLMLRFFTEEIHIYLFCPVVGKKNLFVEFRYTFNKVFSIFACKIFKYSLSLSL